MAPWFMHAFGMWMANVAVGCVCLLFAAFGTGRSGLVRSRQFSCIATVWVAMTAAQLMSPLESDYIGISWLRLFNVAAALYLFLGATDFFQRRRDGALILACAVGIAAVIYAVMLAVFWNQVADPRAWPWMLHGPLSIHMRLVAYGVCVSALCSAWLFLTKDEVSSRTFSWLAFTSALAVLFWSGGRGGMLSAGLGLMVMFILHPWRSARQAWLLLAGGAVLALAVAACFPVKEAGMGWQDAFFRSVQADDVDRLSSLRLKLWKEVVPYVDERFWSGWGGEAYARLCVRTPGLVAAYQVHNGWLQMHLEWGFGVALLVWSGIAFLLWRGLRAVRAPDVIVRDRNLWRLGFPLSVALSFYAMTDGVLYHGIALFYFTLALAMLAASLRGVRGTAGV